MTAYIKAGDGVWSLSLRLPVGQEIRYKYTNSGKPGIWSPGEEFPTRNRVLVLTDSAESYIVRDTFGLISER